MDESRDTTQLVLEDRFTMFVMSRIPDEVRASLTAEQYQAIRTAIYRSRPGQGHAVDLRFSVPLVLFRGYVVLQMGKDRRARARPDDKSKPQSALSRIVGYALFAVLAYSAVVLVLGVLYLLKSLLGINLLPDKHLLDLLSR
jgi:hypothetical protein